MKKLTVKEILEIVETNYSVDTFAYDDFMETKDPSIYETIKNDTKDWKDLDWAAQQLLITNEIGLGEVKEIIQVGGEDQGSDWYSIKHFKDHDVYIKTSGYYQSHHGTDFECGYGEEVKPVEKTITVYE